MKLKTRDFSSPQHFVLVQPPQFYTHSSSKNRVPKPNVGYVTPQMELIYIYIHKTKTCTQIYTYNKKRENIQKVLPQLLKPSNTPIKKTLPSVTFISSRLPPRPLSTTSSVTSRSTAVRNPVESSIREITRVKTVSSCSVMFDVSLYIYLYIYV